MEELKPCPFCGGEAIIDRLGTNRRSCCIICTECGCDLETGEVDDDCGKAWNTRDDDWIKADTFACYLIDHHEGDIITEELLQTAYYKFLEAKPESLNN